MSNPPLGLYVLTAAYLVFYASVHAASNNFDGAHPALPSGLSAFQLQASHRYKVTGVTASARCCRDHAALTTP